MNTEKTVTVDYEEFQSLVNFQKEIIKDRNKITFWTFGSMFIMIDAEDGQSQLKDKFDEMEYTIHNLKTEKQKLENKIAKMNRTPWYKFW